MLSGKLLNPQSLPMKLNDQEFVRLTLNDVSIYYSYETSISTISIYPNVLLYHGRCFVKDCL